MTRILCMADTHLGAGTEYGTQPYGDGSRLVDQERVLVEILDLVSRERVDLVLHAGDVFHRPKPTPAELRVWQDFVQQLHVPFRPIVIAGNHDVAGVELPTGIELFDAACLVDRAPRVHQMGSVDVATLPWAPPAQLAAQLDSYDRDELHQRLAELLVQTAAGLRAQCQDGLEAILMAHWSVSGAVSASGQDVGLFRETVLPLHELEAQGWDAIVLGHIHKHQWLNHDQRIFYPGSCPLVDFGEASDPHGVVILDIADGRVEPHDFAVVGDRPFVTLDFGEITGDLDMGDLCDHVKDLQWRDKRFTGAVVRVRYEATPDQARRVDHAAIRQALLEAGAHRVYQIQPTIVRRARARIDAMGDDLDETAALDLWLTHSETPEAIAGAVRDQTSTYLQAARA